MRRAIDLILCTTLLLPVVALSQPTCAPGLWGDALRPSVERTDAGWLLYWACKRPDGTYTAPGFACRHGQCISPDLFAVRLRDIILSSDKEAAGKAAWQQHITGDCASPTEDMRVVCAELRERQGQLLASLAAPAETWVVSRNSLAADGSRPVYQVVNGVRQTTAIPGVRAAAGSPCDCSVKFATGVSTYCGVNGRTDQVALCVIQ